MTKQTDRPSEPEQAPPAARERPKATWFERYGRPVVQRNRAFALAFVMALAVAGMAWALAALVPLHKPVAFVYEVDGKGRIVGSARRSETFQAGDQQIRYWITEFIRKLYVLHPRRTVPNIKEAYEHFTVGEAADLFEASIKKREVVKQISQDEDLRASVDINGFNWLEKPGPDTNSGTVYVEFVQTKRTSGSSPEQTAYTATIDFYLDPPESPSAIEKNPVGLKVTNFSISRQGT